MVVRLVTHEPFALGKPCNTESTEGQRFAPEEQMAGMASREEGANGETDHDDHATDHDDAARRVDSISVLFARGEVLFWRGFAEQKNANVGED